MDYHQAMHLMSNTVFFNMNKAEALKRQLHTERSPFLKYGTTLLVKL